MATFVASSSATNTAPALPTGTTTDDMVVAFVYNGTTTAIPALAAGWTNITSVGGNSCAVRVQYRIKDATWTTMPSFGGSRTEVATIRPGSGFLLEIGASPVATTNTATQATWPALALQVTDGSSQVLRGAVSSRRDVAYGNPAGHTTVVNPSGSQPAYITTRVTNTTSAPAASTTGSNGRNNGNSLAQVEIVDVAGPVLVEAIDDVVAEIIDSGFYENTSAETILLEAIDDVNVIADDAVLINDVFISTPDSILGVVQESSGVSRVTLSASDTVRPITTELSSTNVFRAAQDTLPPGISDSSQPVTISGLVTYSSTETISASVLESTSVFVTRSSVETLSPVLTDSSSFGTIAVNSSDSASPSIADSSSFGTVNFSSSDTIKPVISDASGFAPVEVTSLDTIYPAATDSSSFVTYGTGADVLAPGVVESPSVIVVSGLITKSASEAIAPGVVEQTSTAAVFTRTDTANPTVVESFVFAPVGVTAVDTGRPLLSDSSSFGTVSVYSTDLASFVLSESSSISAVGIGGDLASPSIQESSSIEIYGSMFEAASDTVSLNIVESSSIELPLSSSDSVSPSLTETSAVLFSGSINQNGVDNLSTVVTESSKISVQINTSDFTRPVIGESSQFGTVVIANADTLRPVVSESSGFSTVTVSSQESISPFLAETRSIRVSLSGNDSLSPEAVETSQVSVGGPVVNTSFDTITPVLAESSFVTTSANLDDFDSVSPSVDETSQVSIHVHVISHDTFQPQVEEASEIDPSIKIENLNVPITIYSGATKIQSIAGNKYRTSPHTPNVKIFNGKDWI